MCELTASEVKSDGVAVAAAINNIATVLDATEPTLGAQITADANALLAVTNSWTTGSVVADFNDAASAVEAALNLVPETASVVPFVEIAVTALDVLIANVGKSPAAGQPATPITVESVKEMQARIATFPPNKYRGKIQIKRHHFQSPRAATIGAWNDQMKKTPVEGIKPIS